MQPSVMPRPESASPPSPSPHEGPSAPPPVRSYSELYRLQQSQPVEVARAEPLADHASNEGGPAAGNASNEGGPAAGRETLAASSSSSSGGIGMSRVGGDGDADSVASTLSRAQQALDKAESSLEGIESLPSARQEAAAAEGGWRARLPHILAAARAAAIIVTVSALVLASHAFGLLVQWTAAVCGGLAVAAWGYKRGSLSASGALAAAAMGIATLGCSLRFGATLLAFFFTSRWEQCALMMSGSKTSQPLPAALMMSGYETSESLPAALFFTRSKLTQFKEELKEGLDDQAKKGGQRDWVQVGGGWMGVSGTISSWWDRIYVGARAERRDGTCPWWGHGSPAGRILICEPCPFRCAATRWCPPSCPSCTVCSWGAWTCPSGPSPTWRRGAARRPLRSWEDSW